MLRGSLRPSRLALWAGVTLSAAGAGCATRERITFPPEVQTAPQSRITVPPADATVDAGPQLTFVAVVEAPNGIDTIYAQDTVSGQEFPPVTGANSPATVGYPFATTGRAGDTIVLRVFATDSAGLRGDTAYRRVAIQ